MTSAALTIFPGGGCVCVLLLSLLLFLKADVLHNPLCERSQNWCFNLELPNKEKKETCNFNKRLCNTVSGFVQQIIIQQYNEVVW